MRSSFSHSVEVECPFCPPMGKRQRKPLLECNDQNYSGCGVDMGNCPECGRGFQISYRVAEVTHIPDWDGESREQWEERAERERLRDEKDQAARDLAEFERLRQKLEK